MLSELENWYLRQCNGDWEHAYGVQIGTLDNPGWSLRIDLSGTRREGTALSRVTLERSNRDWIVYWVEDEQFKVACGPQNLSEAVSVFLQWFDGE